MSMQTKLTDFVYNNVCLTHISVYVYKNIKNKPTSVIIKLLLVGNFLVVPWSSL